MGGMGCCSVWAGGCMEGGGAGGRLCLSCGLGWGCCAIGCGCGSEWWVCGSILFIVFESGVMFGGRGMLYHRVCWFSVGCPDVVGG